MKTSAATPLLILIGLTLLLMGATIDLLGNALVLGYRILKPITARLVRFLRAYTSHQLIKIGQGLTTHFYLVDNEDSLPSVADALCCSILVDLGRVLGYVGTRLKEPENNFSEAIEQIFE